jgi:hypothetical protein
MRRIGRAVAIFAIMAWVSPRVAEAQDLKLNSIVTTELALGTNAIVQIDGLSAALGAGKAKLSDFILYLDGYAVANGADGALSDVAHNKLAFPLQRTSAYTTSWVALLGSPTRLQRPVQVDVGIAGKQNVLATASGQPLQAMLVVVRLWGLIVGFVFLAAVICAMVALGSATDFLRDSQPTGFGGAVGANNAPLRRPFSLAQSQMAWWFALVIAAFIFLYLLTGDFNTLTAQALTLVGIGTGTALGAVMVEKTKTDPVQQEFSGVLARIAQLEAAGTAPAVLNPVYAKRNELADKLASKNFLIDTLTDVDGVSLHRFQILAWTLVIGIVFCIEVYRNLALPTFDETVLAILGISAGTYLGFKIPEQPA